MTRPQTDRISFFDVVKVDIVRDLDNGCLELRLLGKPDKYGHVDKVTVLAWTADMGTPPPIEILEDIQPEKDADPEPVYNALCGCGHTYGDHHLTPGTECSYPGCGCAHFKYDKLERV